MLFELAVYGGATKMAQYDVRGVYTFADSGEERYATTKFNGVLEYKGAAHLHRRGRHRRPAP